MPLFRYKALSTSGETLDGQMEAASREEVIARLQDQGHLPVDARRADEAGQGGGLFSGFGRKDMDAAQLRQFTEQLATLLGAGQPLDRALGTLIELPETGDAKKVVERIREAVRGGTPLSTALEQQHGLFSRVYVNLVRAGEAGGGLHASLLRLADYLARSAELRARLINAMIYPALLMVVVGGAVVFLLMFVVPQFQALFDNLEAELPWYTQALMWTSDALRGWWWLGLALVAATLVWLNARLADPAFRLALDERLLASRLIGSLVARLDTARLARTLGTLVDNGVPLLTALNLSRPVLVNSLLGKALETATGEVKTGSGLGYAMARQKCFPRLAVQMIQVGEESGELDTMLLKVADTFDAETGNAINRLMALLVPVLTVLMTIVVAAIILAVLLPIYDLTGSL